MENLPLSALPPTAPDCVMIDIETFGTSSRAALVEIGAVLFNYNGAPVLPNRDAFKGATEFAHSVDLVSSLMAGGRRTYPP